MTRAFARLTFTDAVKAAQHRNGARPHAERLETRGTSNDALTPELARFVEARDSCFLATANSEGWPYIQHRGGAAGFLRVLDPVTLAFADYAGNRQYLSVGNLGENDRVMLFLMDWTAARRLKIWGRAEVIEDRELAADLMPRGYDATAERVIRIRIEAWDLNCSQHIQRRFSETELRPVLAAYEERIAALEQRLQARS